jgi:hypothetical protein
MFVAIDIGGTNIRIAKSDSLSSVGNLEKTKLLNHNNPKQDILTIQEIINSFSKETLEGIGISIAGQIDKAGTLLFAPNFSTWNNLPVKKTFQDFGKCPTVLLNDGVAGALGETVFQENKGKDFIYVVWGTGIGGAEVTYMHAKPVAKQLHWNSHFPKWENDCGGKRIHEIFGKSARDLTPEEWHVVEEKFSLHLEKFIQKTSASLIIFGGGIGINQPNHIFASAQRIPGNTTKVAISTLGENANILGSFYVLQESLTY